MKGRKAVIYCRVSTAGQAEQGVSLEAQEERLRAYCQMQGLDGSGPHRGACRLQNRFTRPMDRAGQMVKNGTVQHVVAEMTGSFANVDALSVTSEWDKAGITTFGGMGSKH